VINLSSSTLTLFPSGSQRFLIVNNTSTTNSALNVSATLPPDWSDVAQDASNCLNITPLGNCQLGFTPGSKLHDLTLVPVAGTNTNSVNASMSVSYPWITDGQVSAILSDNTNGLIYIGGSFLQVGPNTGFGVPLDETSGQGKII
jgi:hypothetical protein